MNVRASEDHAALERRLLAWIAEITPASVGVTPDTSIVEGGLFDSLALVSLVEWAEHEIGHPLDPDTFDLVAEWPRVSDVLAFVERERDRWRSPES